MRKTENTGGKVRDGKENSGLLTPHQLEQFHRQAPAQPPTTRCFSHILSLTSHPSGPKTVLNCSLVFTFIHFELENAMVLRHSTAARMCLRRQSYMNWI